jgi:hypothetical protein
MKQTIPKAMQKVLGETANQLAKDMGFVKRERMLSGSSFVAGLVFGWINDPSVSLAGLSQSIGNVETPIKRQSLEARFEQAETNPFLKAVLAASLEANIQAFPAPNRLLNRFTAVELVDSSIVTLPNDCQAVWPGSGGYGNAAVAALKLSVRFDLKQGRIRYLDLSAGRSHDSQALAHQAPLMAGSLRIEDLGYFSLKNLEVVAQQQAYYLTRYKQGTSVYSLQGEALDLAAFLPSAQGQRLDCDLRLGQKQALTCRLVAERVPNEVRDQRRQRLQETARRCQQAVSARAWALAAWTIYLTNLPKTLATSAEILLLGRYRWQIELLFKLWKSDLHIDEWQSKKPQRILAELYGKLIGAIITHWLLLLACWHNPRRSLRQAMPTIRALAWQFANSLGSLAALRRACDAVIRSLAKTAMDKSQRRPCTFQLLEALIP